MTYVLQRVSKILNENSTSVVDLFTEIATKCDSAQVNFVDFHFLNDGVH